MQRDSEYADIPAAPTNSHPVSILTCLLAVAVYLAGGALAGIQAGILSGFSEVTHVMVANGALYSAIGMVAVFFLQHRHKDGLAAFVGETFAAPFWVGVGCLGLALVFYLSMVNDLEIGYEPYLFTLFDGLSSLQGFWFAFNLIITRVIAEELLLRHFIMGLLPWHIKAWRWLALCASAALFTAIQPPFVDTSSYLMTFTIGLVLGVARMDSKGLLVPIVLHMLTQVVVVLTNVG